MKLHLKKTKLLHSNNYSTGTTVEDKPKKQKKAIKIKTAEEQLEEAVVKKSTAKIRRQTVFNTVHKFLPKHIQKQNVVTVTPAELAAKLKELETHCDIKSQLSASIGVKILKDNFKQTLKESGLKSREKAELELLALIEMAKVFEGLLSCIRNN